MLTNIPQFSYHIGWRSRGRHAGRHISTQRGMGMEFRGHTTLLSYPDPRRIDIRQTMRDPMEQIYVRVFNQKSATPVFALIDLSGSMNVGRHQRKLQLAAEIAMSVAQSATSNHDPIGVIGFDHTVREDWMAISSIKPQAALALCEKLTEYHAPMTDNQGMADISRFLPRERSLVFLISDFHMPIDKLDSALSLMLRHHIVPVVLWDSAEYRDLPEFGIANITDAETQQQRTVFLRKTFRQQIIDAFEQRRADIHALFMQYDMPPFFVENHFNADALTDYFHQFVVA